MTDLATRIEQATGPDRELDAEIFIAVCWPDWRVQASCDNFPEEVRPGRIQEPNGCGWRNAPTYTASIDAAMTLAPVDRQIEILLDAINNNCIVDRWLDHLPRFISAAALRAREAKP